MESSLKPEWGQWGFPGGSVAKPDAPSVEDPGPTPGQGTGSHMLHLRPCVAK